MNIEESLFWFTCAKFKLHSIFLYKLMIQHIYYLHSISSWPTENQNKLFLFGFWMGSFACIGSKVKLICTFCTIKNKCKKSICTCLLMANKIHLNKHAISVELIFLFERKNRAKNYNMNRNIYFGMLVCWVIRCFNVAKKKKININKWAEWKYSERTIKN